MQTITVLRDSFWATHTEFSRVSGRKQNEYPADIRMAWVDFVDQSHRAGLITDSVAQRATL